MEINSCSHEYYANGNPISFNPSRLRFVDSLEEQIPRDELGSSKRSSSNTHNCDTKNPQEVLLISQNRTVLIRVDLPISFFSPPISMSKQNFCDFHFGFGGLLFGISRSCALPFVALRLRSTLLSTNQVQRWPPLSHETLRPSIQSTTVVPSSLVFRPPSASSKSPFDSTHQR